MNLLCCSLDCTGTPLCLAAVHPQGCVHVLASLWIWTGFWQLPHTWTCWISLGAISGLLDLNTDTILSPLAQKCLSLGLLLSLGTGPSHWILLSLLAPSGQLLLKNLEKEIRITDLEKLE